MKNTKDKKYIDELVKMMNISINAFLILMKKIEKLLEKENYNNKKKVDAEKL